MRPSRGPRNPQASGTIVQVHQREQVARRVALYLLFNEGYHDVQSGSFSASGNRHDLY
jgi:hypothetical protein